MRQHVAYFANFVCRFGDERVLLDYAKEIILPAFLDDTFIRSYGRTHFFFYETQLVTLDDAADPPVLALTGRFIKNTQLTREQIFDPERGLIQDEASLPSAPSAHFVLVLNNHRLLYFPETAHAPELRAFRSTALDFIRRKHKAFVKERHESLREQGTPVTKKKLWEEHPPASLEIIPISGDEEIEAFLSRYSVLKKIDFKLVTPNDEIDGEELFADIRAYFAGMRPESTKIETRNAEGLDIDHSLEAIKAATATANQEVRLSGTDHNGNELKGDNHEFQIGTPVEPIPATRAGLTQKLFSIFKALVGAGAIKVGTQTEEVEQRIRDISELL